MLIFRVGLTYIHGFQSPRELYKDEYGKTYYKQGCYLVSDFSNRKYYFDKRLRVWRPLKKSQECNETGQVE